MALERPSLSTIYNRIKADMESRVTEGVKVPRFSLLGILAIVFSGAMHLVYGYLFWIIDQVFPDTADERFLARLGSVYSLPRRGSTQARGQATFTGTNGTTIPAGTELEGDNGVIYLTQSETIITGGTATVVVIAQTTNETGGSVGNLAVGQEISFVNPLPDVNTVATVSAEIAGGSDQESIADWRIRIQARFSDPPASGSRLDYRRWALEVAGVGKAWILPADQWQGLGTVAVILAESDLTPVPSTVKQNVVNYIEARRPIGANVSVVDVQPVGVQYSIQITPNTAANRTAIEAALKQLHLTEAEPGGELLLSHVRSAIASSGVDDYRLTTIVVLPSTVVPPGDNINTLNFDVPVFDNAIFSTLVS